MKRKLILSTAIILTTIMASAQSKVYMTREISPESLVKIYQALGRPAEGHRVAVKISTGEAGNPNYLQPTLIKALVDSVHGTTVSQRQPTVKQTEVHSRGAYGAEHRHPRL